MPKKSVVKEMQPWSALYQPVTQPSEPPCKCNAHTIEGALKGPSGSTRGCGGNLRRWQSGSSGLTRLRSCTPVVAHVDIRFQFAGTSAVSAVVEGGVNGNASGERKK